MPNAKPALAFVDGRRLNLALATLKATSVWDATGGVGDTMNLLLAATASNLSLWMRELFAALILTLQKMVIRISAHSLQQVH